MASKRKLKKEIIELVTIIYEEAYLLSLLATDKASEELNKLMDDVMVFTDDSLRRVQHPDGKDEPRLVKAHYRKLREDLKAKVAEFDARLEKHLAHEA